MRQLSDDLGRSFPALDTKPDIPDDLVWFWQVYQHLSNSRNHTGFGEPLPIQISEIKAYCEFFEILSLETRDMLLQIVYSLEVEFFNIRTARSQQKQASRAGHITHGRRPH